MGENFKLVELGADGLSDRGLRPALRAEGTNGERDSRGAPAQDAPNRQGKSVEVTESDSTVCDKAKTLSQGQRASGDVQDDGHQQAGSEEKKARKSRTNCRCQSDNNYLKSDQDNEKTCTLPDTNSRSASRSASPRTRASSEGLFVGSPPRDLRARMSSAESASINLTDKTLFSRSRWNGGSVSDGHTEDEEKAKDYGDQDLKGDVNHRIANHVQSDTSSDEDLQKILRDERRRQQKVVVINNSPDVHEEKDYKQRHNESSNTKVDPLGNFPATI